MKANATAASINQVRARIRLIREPARASSPCLSKVAIAASLKWVIRRAARTRPVHGAMVGQGEVECLNVDLHVSSVGPLLGWYGSWVEGQSGLALASNKVE